MPEKHAFPFSKSISSWILEYYPDAAGKIELWLGPVIRESSLKEIIYPYQCLVEAAFGFIGGKWKALIVWNIGSENRRFSELKQVLPKISPRILSRQLKTLERDGIIARKHYWGIHPRVEYTLTAGGLDLILVLNLACEWTKVYYPERVPQYCMKKIKKRAVISYPVPTGR